METFLTIRRGSACALRRTRSSPQVIPTCFSSSSRDARR